MRLIILRSNRDNDVPRHSFVRFFVSNLNARAPGNVSDGNYEQFRIRHLIHSVS